MRNKANIDTRNLCVTYLVGICHAHVFFWIYSRFADRSELSICQTGDAIADVFISVLAFMAGGLGMMYLRDIFDELDSENKDEKN